MKANELRIGNLVWLYCHHEPVSVVQIFKEDNEYWLETDLHEGEKLGIFEPIPLTEEWLVKFGFERNGSQFWYKSYDYTIDTRGNKLVVHSDYASSIYGTEVKYVNQLQNLFFALTGEELILKP
jgi:hypothetical protein